MRPIASAVLAVALAMSSVASADVSQAIREHVPLLETYESYTIGWTNDSDDVGFLDINLSLKYPIMPKALGGVLRYSRVYFAASTRFAQYLDTRPSSPVIGKRFNPKLLWRQVINWYEKGSNAGKTCDERDSTDGCDYVDIAFAHESNGQSVDDAREFEVQNLVQRGQVEFARDHISRGWDYLELAGRKWVGHSGKFRLDYSLKHFLREGPLQGKAEDFFDFERVLDPEVKHRRRVHGLGLHGTWQPSPGTRVAVGLETGSSRPFRHNTARVEGNMEFAELPLMLFYQQGYGSDLTLFYRRVSSWGIALALSTF